MNYNNQNYPQTGQNQYSPGPGNQNQTYQQPFTQQNMQQNTGQQSVIKNQKSNVFPKMKTPEMNERDFVNDILATEKYLSDNMNIFTREASHATLYKDIKHILNETHECAREIFNLMFAEGVYKLKAADNQEIQKARQQFTNYIDSQGPYGNTEQQYF